MENLSQGLHPTDERLLRSSTSIVFHRGLQDITFNVEDENHCSLINLKYERKDSIIRSCASIRFVIITCNHKTLTLKFYSHEELKQVSQLFSSYESWQLLAQDEDSCFSLLDSQNDEICLQAGQAMDVISDVLEGIISDCIPGTDNCI